MALTLSAFTDAARGEGPCAALTPRYDGPLHPQSRIAAREVAGRRVIVILPGDYLRSRRRYAVLYALHGAISTPDEWLATPSLLALTREAPVIVVAPAGGHTGFYSDWNHDPDGSDQWETFHLTHLLPFVDREYRTLRGRRHRAVLGVSMGGFGALHYAAHRPDLFSAAASISGIADIRHPLFHALYPAGVAAEACYNGRLADPNDIWGPPITAESRRADANPADLAPNLDGVDVFLSTGTGLPCDGADVAELVASDAAAGQEFLMRELNDSLHRALLDERVAHHYERLPCGLHTRRTFERGLRAALPRLIARLGTPTPRRFRHRRAAARFSVWGWTFTADNRRTPQFLDVDVAARRVSLTGSGIVRVETPRVTRGRARIRLDGARRPYARADRGGRIRFTADLGPPYGGRWDPAAPRTTRTVRIGVR